MPLSKKGKSPGWAAFGECNPMPPLLVSPQLPTTTSNDDSFPPMPSPRSSWRPSTSQKTQAQTLPLPLPLPRRSFSSVVLPSGTHPPPAGNCSQQQVPIADSGTTREHSAAAISESIKKLQGLHCWADDDLITDVMAAADGDVTKASTLLADMVSPPDHQPYPYTTIQEPPDTPHCGLGGTTNAAEILHDFATTHVNFDPRWLHHIPVEPDWEEEDDFYLSHRKDAVKMTRVASQHSRAAANAFIRGDHLYARQLSLKAQQEWRAAEMLHDRAAKLILSIRNSENNLWKLDLHGLHAVEAVRAVQDHLQRIEYHFSLNRPVSPDRLKTGRGVMPSSSTKSLSLIDKEGKDSKQQDLTRERSTALQIITGIGNHSRGQAALPMAVRSFLDENGYHYDEVRPGVISVRVKFRRK